MSLPPSVDPNENHIPPTPQIDSFPSDQKITDEENLSKVEEIIKETNTLSENRDINKQSTEEINEGLSFEENVDKGKNFLTNFLYRNKNTFILPVIKIQ